MTQVGVIRRDIVQLINQRCEEEGRNPPVPRKYGDIPISYESITAEWLTATLASEKSATSVKAFKLGPKDDGTSNRRRIELQWEGPEASSLPTSVFCKAAHDKRNRITLSNAGTHSEISFYNLVRPRIDIEAPEALFAAYDPESWASMIMLKDMDPRTEFCTYKTVLSKTQFAEQIQILAQLHGRFHQCEDPLFSSLIQYRDRFQNLIKSLDIETVCGNGFDAAKTVIPPELFARQADIWPATVKSVEVNASLPQTIVHGDVHLGNWYITPDQRMGLADWQATSRGHWSRDLAYVLGTAVSVENRRLWEHEMVLLYISELEKAGGPKIAEAEAWVRLRQQTFGALWYWTFTLTPSSIMPDMQSEETSLEFIGRITALIHDHNALDSFEP